MDRKKIRKPLSILLVFAMISSLFTGTAIAKIRSASSELFEKAITVLVSQEGDQISQKFKIKASASQAELASASVAIKASGSEAERLGTVEFGDSNDEIVITPVKASPSSATVEMTSGEKSWRSEVNFKWNWFKNSNGTLGADADNITLKRADGVSESNGTISILSEEGEAVTGILGTAESTADGITIPRGTKAVSQQTTVRLEMKSGDKLIGICDITVEPKANNGGGETEKTLKVFSKDKDTFSKNEEIKELPLTNEAKSVKNLLKFSVKGESVNLATGGALEIIAEGESTITATFAEESEKGGYAKLESTTYTVDITDKEKAEFFIAPKETKLRNGEVFKLPLTASASEAHRAGTATVESSNEAVVTVDASKTTPGNVYIKAGTPAEKQEAVITFNVGKEYDEYKVIVTPLGQTELFELTDEERANGILMTVKENRTMALTSKAESLLQEAEEDEVELTSDEIVAAEFGPDGSLVFTAKEVGETEITLRIGSVEDSCFVIVSDFADKLDDILDSVTDDMSNDEIKSTVDALEQVISEIASKQPEYFNTLAKEDPDAVDSQMQKIDLLEKQIKEKFQVSTETTVESQIVDPEDVEVIGLALHADLTKIGQMVKLAIADTKRPSKTDGITFSKKSVAFNIDLFADGKSADVKSPIKVTMTAPLDADELIVYHIHGGKVTQSRVEVVDGKISLYITRLSTFVFDYADPDGGNNEVPDTDYRGSSSRGGSGGFSSNKAARNLYSMIGNWEQVGASWKFKKLNGYFAKNEWGYINNSYYYFGDDQLMKTGWQYISNAWYYLNPATGSEEGKMLTGWQQINGSLYYLNTSGAMAADQYVDGYYVNASGARVQ